MTTPDVPLRSHFLVGTIRHRRSSVVTYEFTHRVWYLALDLSEQDAVERRLKLLSFNRRNVLEVRDTDHLTAPSGLRDAIDRRLVALGLEPARFRVTLIAYPRAFGYVFNPVSFYLCHDTNGSIRVVLAEVHNTHGDREVYEFVAGESKNAMVFKATQEKRMYVSPFIAPDASYELLLHEQEDGLAITIREREGDHLALVADLQTRRQVLSNRRLLGLLAKDPLVPLRTSLLIFWHAVRLWWRGVPWRRYRRTE